MKRLVLFFTALITVLGVVARTNIKAIDVHSHIVTDDYLNYLAYNDALMADGYPLLLKQGLTEPIDIDGNLSRLYYDLAGGLSVQAIKMLLTVTTPDHIMFGTDYPFVPVPILEKVAAKVRNEIIQDEQLGQYADDIIRNNAMKLFKTEE
ncbi:MAG: hypothetical protein K2G09_07235 [Paramuribaculum sp.]|nr:hypothetical protein [Paramuribaculum sp.]